MDIYLSEYFIFCAEAETSSLVDEEFYACSKASLWSQFLRLTCSHLLHFRFYWRNVKLRHEETLDVWVLDVCVINQDYTLH